MEGLPPVVLTYRELLYLVCCGFDFVPDVIEQMRELLGDTAFMYQVEFRLDKAGNTHIQVVPQAVE